MNKHELHGGARYVGGKVEKAVGDVADSRDWKVDGVVDQVAGATENLYGRAQSIADDAVDAAPHIVDKGREALSDVADRTIDAVRTSKDAVVRTAGHQPMIVWAAAAAISGYALSWLIHGRRA